MAIMTRSRTSLAADSTLSGSPMNGWIFFHSRLSRSSRFQEATFRTTASPTNDAL